MEFPIINKTYEVYKTLVDINHKLNKRWAFSLGLSTENSLLELMGQLIMAKNAPKPLKTAYLIKASAHWETTTLKIRLLLELKLVNETRIFQLQSNLAEIGRMLGGWLKSSHG
ncbi:MAG: four helix bundle protein [Bacteroidetes bacterium]|nr:four helix bundle protein [Bacteroidota bacterium]